MATKETNRTMKGTRHRKQAIGESEREEEVEEHLVERSPEFSDATRVTSGRTQTNPSGSISGHHANVGSENRWKRVEMGEGAREREMDRGGIFIDVKKRLNH